jgi:putative endopeptidase
MKDYLSINLEKICFNFYEKVLNGTQKIKPLEQRVLLNTENQLGQLIGQCFVKKYFSSNAKKVIGEMIKYLKNEFRNSIQNLEWMENSTKTKALNKLDNMKIKIAHPTKWRVYTTDIRKEYSYFKNNIMCNIANNEYTFNKLYKEINRNEWFMNPQKVNAYYSPTYNEIVFPAGILQPPFFSENYDKAINFGGIGSVICHEITHGFDDKGCKYDAYGNLKNWWHKSDFKKYKSKTLILKNQFDNYIIEGVKVNGELTLGENLADFGGLTIALRGLKKYLNDTDNYNLKSIQNFFISYARVWCSSSRKKDIIQRLLVDVHCPPLLRVNGIVKNIPEFYEAFNIKETDELYLEPKKRAKIW